MKTLVALGRRPVLAWEAVHAAWAFRRRGGLLPSRPLLAWRRATAYTTSDHPVEVDDLVAYLSWRRRYRAALGRSS